MERRNRSLKALEELTYIDSLDDNQKAPALQRWSEKYLDVDISESFDLELLDLQKLSELFYKNINFLKEYRVNIKKELDKGKDIKKFFS
ncbi:MAG: hypothetical protein KAQ94_05070 [Arcobacteraceae bacterium]|nr:hypothetical protein [Arcobacteraceae bacterium]